MTILYIVTITTSHSFGNLLSHNGFITINVNVYSPVANMYQPTSYDMRAKAHKQDKGRKVAKRLIAI